MKNKALFLAIAIALTLSACSSKSTSPNQKGNSDAVSTASTAEATTNSAIISSTAESNNSSEAASNTSTEEPSAEAGYKQAYKEIIEADCEKKASLTEEASYDELAECIDCYWLYDIDKDNVPELLIRYGDCEAAYHGKLYSYIDGETKFIDDLSMGHTGFYAVPGENGILSYWGHMGYAECWKLTLNGTVLSSEELYSEDINEKMQAGEDVWYKASNEIVPGAYYLDSYDYNNTYPIEMYETITAYANGKEKSDPENYSFPDNNPDYYTDIMQKDVMVNAVALDQFMNALGEVPFSKLFEEKQIYDYAPGGLTPLKITYADLNADGIYECIFYLNEGNNPEDQYMDYRVILSLQSDTIYAYLNFCPYETSITEDGYFITEPDEYASERYVKRVLYDREKCFIYSVPSEG